MENFKPTRIHARTYISSVNLCVVHAFRFWYVRVFLHKYKQCDSITDQTINIKIYIYLTACVNAF